MYDEPEKQIQTEHVGILIIGISLNFISFYIQKFA